MAWCKNKLLFSSLLQNISVLEKELDGALSKWIRNSVTSGNPLWYQCLAGAVVVSWSLTQEAVGSLSILKK